MSKKCQKTLNLAIFKMILLTLANEAAGTEFNYDALNLEGQSDIDLSVFSQADALMEGEYYVDILLNGKKLPKSEQILFKTQGEDNVVQACIPFSLLDKFGLKRTTISQAKSQTNLNCLDLKSIDNNINTVFNQETQELLVNIPQAYFLYDDPDWIPPKQRDQGINGIVLDYNINTAYSKVSTQASSINTNVYGEVGGNIDAWRIRAEYQYNNNQYDGKTDDHFAWNQVYAYRDIGSLNAKLTVGDNYLTTDLFNSFRYRGAVLATDELMLPDQLRGYAPTVSGVAKSNAMVTITQDNRLIKQVSVPQGPFWINDITSGVSGTLDVSIKEENGEITRYKVYAMSTPFLSRSGQLRYKVNAGKVHAPDTNLSKDYYFAMAEGSYGLSPNTSIYGGVLSMLNNTDYQTFSIGMGQNLGPLGSVSMDVTHSINNVVLDKKKQSGNSYRFNYSKRIDGIGGQINFLGYRFSDKKFMSTTQFINYVGGNRADWHREKNQLMISYSQYLEKLNLSLQLSGSHYDYWDGEKNQSATGSLSGNVTKGFFNKLNYALSMTRYRNKSDRNNQYMLSFSMPLGERKSIYYTSSYDNRNKQSSNTVSFNHQLANERTDYSLSVSANHQELAKATMRANLNHRTIAGDIRVMTSYNSDYQYASASYNGSLTATKHGVAVGPMVFRQQARVVLDADDVANISIQNGLVKTNRFGLAVASNVSTYRQANIVVDLEKAPSNVAIDGGVVQTMLTSGAIGYGKITADSGEQMVGTIVVSDDKSNPPFGAVVYNQKTGKEAGMVSENGRAYITGIKDESQFTVKWQDNQCQIAMKPNQYDSESLNEFKCTRN